MSEPHTEAQIHSHDWVAARREARQRVENMDIKSSIEARVLDAPAADAALVAPGWGRRRAGLHTGGV